MRKAVKSSGGEERMGVRTLVPKEHVFLREGAAGVGLYQKEPKQSRRFPIRVHSVGCV